MRYVSITPRVDAWLRAIPIALIGAILGPIAVNGGPPEWLGLAVAIGLMYFTANEFVATIGACAAVALTRALMAHDSADARGSGHPALWQKTWIPAFAGTSGTQRITLPAAPPASAPPS